MKNYYLHYSCIIISSLFLFACSQSKNIEKVEFLDSKHQNKISLHQVEQLSPLQQSKYKRALRLIESLLNSQEFKALILKGPDTQRYIEENEAQTNKCDGNMPSTYTYNTVRRKCFNNNDIYKIVKAAEWKLKVAVSPSSGNIKCGKLWSNTLGSLEGETIVTPECKFQTMSDELLAGFLIHEYLHVIGFKHPFNPSTNRKYTIPYFIGDKAIELLSKRRVSTTIESTFLTL